MLNYIKSYHSLGIWLKTYSLYKKHMYPIHILLNTIIFWHFLRFLQYHILYSCAKKYISFHVRRQTSHHERKSPPLRWKTSTTKKPSPEADSSHSIHKEVSRLITQFKHVALWLILHLFDTLKFLTSLTKKI